MKRALVLSGGGAKGAFHVGALTKLWETGIEFDLISGVSVGALNGAMVAQDKKERLLQIWANVRQTDVFRRNLLFGKEWPSILWRYFTGKDGAYDSRPLLKFIEQEISLQGMKKAFYFGSTSCYDGRYYSLQPGDFADDRGLQMGIYASSLMPIIWEDVTVPLKGGKEILEAVDGGVRTIAPLADLLRQLPDVVYIITCRSDKGIQQQFNKGWMKKAKRVTMDIMPDEIVLNDTQHLLEINELVLQSVDQGFILTNPNSGREYKYFKTVLINPREPIGSALDFTEGSIQSRFKEGYDVVRSLLQKQSLL